jgi:transposase-like protein
MVLGSNFKKPYPPEFRREAVELYRRSGRPLAEIARDLGVATELLRVWVRQAGIRRRPARGLSSEEREELHRLPYTGQPARGARTPFVAELAAGPPRAPYAVQRERSLEGVELRRDGRC